MVTQGVLAVNPWEEASGLDPEAVHVVVSSSSTRRLTAIAGWPEPAAISPLSRNDSSLLGQDAGPELEYPVGLLIAARGIPVVHEKPDANILAGRRRGEPAVQHARLPVLECRLEAVESLSGGNGPVGTDLLCDDDRRPSHREARNRTNAVLSKLLETLPIGVLTEDESREILAANDHLIELFGISETPDDLVGSDCEQVARTLSEQFADPEGFLDRVNEVVSEDIPVDSEEVQLADGRTFVRTHEPVELPDGNGHLWTYRDATTQRRREDRLEALNRTAQELINAESREEIAEIGVTAAQDVLGLDANAIHLADDESALVPVAETESVHALIGELPTFTRGDSIAWRVYETGEAVAIDDTHDDPDIYNPDSPIRSELHFPLGDYGILIAGSPTPDTFDESDLVLGRLLAGSIVTALEQIEQLDRLRTREQELSEQNERLDEFASIVPHDLRNPVNYPTLSAFGTLRVGLVRELGLKPIRVGGKSATQCHSSRL